jgi:hypothetical protein
MSDERETNFEKVVNMNLRAGNAALCMWSQLARQMRIVDSEYKEMVAGLADRDIEEFLDGALDTLVTVYGAIWMAGFNADEAFARVIDALRTRIDTNHENALLSQEYYANRGIKTYIRDSIVADTVYYAIISAENQTDTAGVEYPAGKWLKSRFHKKPDFSDILTPEVREYWDLVART